MYDQRPIIPKQSVFFGRWDRCRIDRAITVNSGSYVYTRFSCSWIAAHFDISLNQTPFPTLAWRIDEQPWQEAELSSSVLLGYGLGAGAHDVQLMVRGLDEHQSRWKHPLVASVTFTGFALSDGGKFHRPLDAWVHPKLTMEFLGDSITEGVIVQEGHAGVDPGMPYTWPWLSDARMSYVGHTARRLGAAYRQVGFGATGLLRSGSGDAPGAIQAFNAFYAGCPRDSWQPQIVVVNQGTNEPDMSEPQYAEHYAHYLGMIRAAYRKALIIGLCPFNGTHRDAIRRAVDERAKRGDRQVRFIDTAGWYDGPLHPNVDGSKLLGEKLAAAIKVLL